MRAIDLTGKKFNRLTVLELDSEKKGSHRYWKCRCDCGKIVSVAGSKLTTGHTKSCGCAKNLCQLDDITGKRFGHLTAISFSHIGTNKRSYWKCRCDCGNEVVKQSKLLRKGAITSCGCTHGKSKYVDISGQRFGKLVALEREDNLWKCRCDCGNIHYVSAGLLRSGNTKSCGCGHHDIVARVDLTGKVFGRLTVISYAYTDKKNAFWNCRCDCGSVLTVHSRNLNYGYVRSCKTCAHTTSTEEKEVVNFIKSIYSGEVIENDRTLAAPKEIDIYIPEKHFAIEYDGIFWHSDCKIKDFKYHLKKTEACSEKGVRLFHLYSSEWRDKQGIVKSMIASALGIYNRRIFARNCELREVTDRKAVANLFNENHLQGTVTRYAKVLGLYYKDELVQACMFGRQHFGKNGDMELYRMVTLRNTQVLGGFSKIMKHCGYGKVISYVSLRTFNAAGYLGSGWTLEHISKPSFCITDGNNLFVRQMFNKAECVKKFNNVTEDMTEKEMQEKNGYYRLWDCGTYKVIYLNYEQS